MSAIGTRPVAAVTKPTPIWQVYLGENFHLQRAAALGREVDGTAAAQGFENEPNGAASASNRKTKTLSLPAQCRIAPCSRRCQEQRDDLYRQGRDRPADPDQRRIQMGHEERERVATAVGLNLVGSFFALRSLDKEFAAMVLRVWDEQVAGENVSMSPPDVTRPPAHARNAARLIREALEIFSDTARE